MASAGYMLDTAVFNRICDGGFAIADLPVASRVYATHVQLDQLKETPDDTLDPDRRAKLLATFQAIGAENLQSTPFIVGVATAGNAQIADNDDYYRAVFAGLKRQEEELGNWRDGVIAATAHAANLTLVTADRRLANAVRIAGGAVQLIARPKIAPSGSALLSKRQ